MVSQDLNFHITNKKMTCSKSIYIVKIPKYSNLSIIISSSQILPTG